MTLAPPTDLKPYPAYKDSGVEWLGEVPEGWEVRRLKRTSRNIVAVGSRSNGEPCLALENVESWSGNLRLDNDVPAPTSQLKKFAPGDILFGKLRPYLAKVARPRFAGFCVGEFLVLRAVGHTQPAYLEKTLRSAGFIALVSGMTEGARMPRAEWADVGSGGIPLPPSRDQTAIVRYLDHIDAHIDCFIAAKQRLIELLEEERQAAIDEAFAGVGLARSDWGPLRRFAEIVDCKHLTVDFHDEGLPCVSVRDVQGFEVNIRGARKIDSKSFELLRAGGRIPSTGDLVYCRNVSVGACALVATAEPFALGQDVCLIRPWKEGGRFLNYFMRSSSMQAQLSSYLVGSTFNRINVAEVKDLTVPKPHVDDQTRIVKALDLSFQRSHAAIARARAQISLLTEFRTRLISDVVTGKLDVRGASAAVAEEALEEAVA